MKEILPLLRGALLLDQPTYERLRDSKNAMRTGVILLLVVFLVAGSLQFVVDLVNNLRPFTVTEAADVQQEIRDSLDQWLQFMPQDEFSQQFMDQFLQNLNAGLAMGVDIDSLDTPLPRGISRFFETLGGWLSQPLGRLAAFLAYGIWVLLFAKLLGGNGGVDRFFGVTALYSVPNLLGFFAPIACIGPLLGFVGMVWGWVVYVKAVQVTQRFDVGKAILATILPALIVTVLAIIGIVAMILSIVAASGSS
jgi:hypothetical protein